MPDYDPVEKPRHYNIHPSGIECIDIVEHFDFCLGSAIKYIWRAGEKNSSTLLEDLKKARWYLDREIRRMEPSDHGTLQHPERQRSGPGEQLRDNVRNDESRSGPVVPGPREGTDPSWPASVPHREEAGRPVLTWEYIEAGGGRNHPSVPLTDRPGPDHQTKPAATGSPTPEAQRDEAVSAWNEQRIQELEAESRRLLIRKKSVEAELVMRYNDARKSSGPDQEPVRTTPVRGATAPVASAGDPPNPGMLYPDGLLSRSRGPHSEYRPAP